MMACRPSYETVRKFISIDTRNACDIGTVDMPTVRGIRGPYRFFFYSFDCNEPMHIHVQQEKMTCKFWINPLALAKNYGFSAKELNTIRAIIIKIRIEYWSDGMNSAVQIQEVKIKHVTVTKNSITAQLIDGRTISVPLVWSWRLSEATPKQRANWQIIGDGHGVHWPELDEDISAAGTLFGIPALRPQTLSKLTPKSEKEAKANNAIHTAFRGPESAAVSRETSL